MNTSDTETSDSTSSSSLGPSTVPENAADGSTSLRVRTEGKAWSTVDSAHSANSPPSYVRGTGDVGESPPYDSPHSHTPRESVSEGDDAIKRSRPTFPARQHTEISSTVTRNQTGAEHSTVQRSTPRQRPLSAPSKAYRFALLSEVAPRQQTRVGRAKSRGTAHGVQEKIDDAGKLGQGGEEKEHTFRDHTASGGARGDERLTEKQRLTLSSILGTARETRTNEYTQPRARPSALPGKEEGAESGTTRCRLGLQEGSGDGRDGKGACLSSQEFGLHRWKEYAVLRHGKNRRFVDSEHGREILAENAAMIRTKEVAELNRELKEMRALVEELHAALRAEQIEKSNLQAKVVLLEREIEGMDFTRRRWLKEEASNRSRGSNLERRLAGNTGNLRTFLFGADAKPETTKLTTPEASPAAGTFRSSGTGSRSLVASSRAHSCGVGSGGGGGGGGTAASEMSAGDEGDRDTAALSAAIAEGNAVRRTRETAELEKCELRRRHNVEMSTKQSRIDRLKLEVRKLEAERDGLKQAAESQAGLFKDGYAELKACLEALKAHRPTTPPTPCELTEPDERVRNSSSRQNKQHQHQEGSSGGDRVTSKPAEGTKDWVETMLATEQGLNHQVRKLQSLLLDAVSAAVPTVAMPAAVTQSVDSIREDMGLPPLVSSRESPPVLRVVPQPSSSRHPIATAAAIAVGRSEFYDLQSTGDGPPERGSNSECDAGRGGEFPTQDGPSRTTQHRHHVPHDWHLSGPATPDVISRSLTERTGLGKCLAVDTPNIGDKPSGRHDISRHTQNNDKDGNSSCTGSGGGSNASECVGPTDENVSEEEGLRSPLSLASHRRLDGETVWKGRDEILRRYLGNGSSGDDGSGVEPLNTTTGPEKTAKGNRRNSEMFSFPRGSVFAVACPTASRNRLSPDISSTDTTRSPALFEGEALVRNANSEKRPEMQRDSTRRKLLAAEQVESGGSTSAVCLADNSSGAAGARPGQLEVDGGEGQSGGSQDGDRKHTRTAESSEVLSDSRRPDEAREQA